jgi:hypothetical protein
MLLNELADKILVKRFIPGRKSVAIVTASRLLKKKKKILKNVYLISITRDGNVYAITDRVNAT